MRVAYVLAGPPASGKSTYVKQNYKTVNESVTVFSSDEIREELFGDLTNPDIYTRANHQKVFDELYKRATNATTNDIVIDSTNLSRKSRRRTYDLLKRSNFKVVVIVFIEPLAVLLDRNSKRHNRVPEQKVREMYVSFEPPKIGVDCDSFEVVTKNPFIKDNLSALLFSIQAKRYGISKAVSEHVSSEYLKELNNGNLTVAHDTPYHLEDIDEHINTCINNSKYDTDLICIATFHDLGKFITKEGGRYYGHQNVSAMYLLNTVSAYRKLDSNVEVVYHHMQAHQGFSNKYINKHKLNEQELTTIKDFAEIDSKSRRI